MLGLSCQGGHLSFQVQLWPLKLSTQHLGDPWGLGMSRQTAVSASLPSRLMMLALFARRWRDEASRRRYSACFTDDSMPTPTR
eukprot:5340667-Amphidinium_carterae.1